MSIKLDRKKLAEQAFEECCSAETTVRFGDRRGRPFWNAEATQFMYVPAFRFTAIRGCHRYRYTAKDERGDIHSFEAKDCCSLLTPIWAELPEGVVQLTVTALDKDGGDYAVVGARTFFRLAPFPEETPPAVRSYRDSAVMGYRYAMSQGFVKHWLEHGVPDPYYDLNVYPSKMISTLVDAMILYAKLCPEEAADAMKIAVKAADFLISITPRGGAPLADVPPTYYLDFCPDPEKYRIFTPNWRAAEAHAGTVMMIYPAQTGLAYLKLEKATGDGKYLEEAVRIGRFYLKTVEPNGSWYLVRSCKTGEPLSKNYVAPIEKVVPFLDALYSRTGDDCWRKLRDNAVEYVFASQLSSYNWEAQFEDTMLSSDYVNLTHYAPTALASYLAGRRGDKNSLELAKELMRFAEDQFVIWRRPAPWSHGSPVSDTPYDTSIWHTPAAIEQYRWYVPIDASTASVALGFLNLYRAGCGDLYLAKARALTDQLTIMQREDGKIPTHWMHTPEAEANFWFNCMLESCRTLSIMSEYE